ncbi:hypothetical protein [Segniliparus rugosus]|uniref:Lipoprotein n=1 Tax=Segniliparus rugosus (strain ATCC BAA-974 / DSM 45345 / CCUG 50838 / CIP 108380 / JCM 13579 / CDC 945) TaxID=679197 RepID=E5XP24_SEGRC|nr:hypothetical protein [Segniliparus rugosus]EFV13916.2 hypothetical protein HMPREF9336_01245 [Segniliparus rugosus ATCC BAA-974]
MRRFFPVLALVLVSALCAACGDSSVPKLGQKIVAELKADPLVAEARYSYWHPGLDDSQEPNIIFSITAASDAVELPAFQPLISKATEEVWQSKTDLTQIWYVITAKGFAPPSSTTWPPGGLVPEGKLIQLCVWLARSDTAQPSSSVQPPEPSSSGGAARWRPHIATNSFNDCKSQENTPEQRFANALSADLRAKYGLHQTR